MSKTIFDMGKNLGAAGSEVSVWAGSDLHLGMPEKLEKDIGNAYDEIEKLVGDKIHLGDLVDLGLIPTKDQLIQESAIGEAFFGNAMTTAASPTVPHDLTMADVSKACDQVMKLGPPSTCSLMVNGQTFGILHDVEINYVKPVKTFPITAEAINANAISAEKLQAGTFSFPLNPQMDAIKELAKQILLEQAIMAPPRPFIVPLPPQPKRTVADGVRVKQLDIWYDLEV